MKLKIQPINIASIKKKFFEKILPKFIPEEGLYTPSTLAFFVIIFSLVSLFLQTRPKVVVTPAKATAQPSMDANIPKDHLLLPIEVSNYESLDSVSGNFSIVDIYSSFENPEKKPKRLAKGVRLFRPNGNPEVFYILVPQGLAEAIISVPGPYRVALRNSHSKIGTNIVKKKARSIIYLKD